MQNELIRSIAHALSGTVQKSLTGGMSGSHFPVIPGVFFGLRKVGDEGFQLAVQVRDHDRQLGESRIVETVRRMCKQYPEGQIDFGRVG